MAVEALIEDGLQLPEGQHSQLADSGSFSVSGIPVFARGKVKIYLCGLDDAGPEKLTDGQSVGKFVQDVLPGVLRSMQAEFGWATLPRVVVHDKASYFVSPQHGRLQRDFALGLAGGGLRSWLGTAWLTQIGWLRAWAISTRMKH